MRLFTAIEPSPDFRDALSTLQEHLGSAGLDARYLEKSNLHLTLAFIGEWTEDVTELLPPVEEPFSITLSNIGYFRKADVLWCGIDPCAALDRLADCVRQRLSAAGVPFDPMPFCPHITLARKPVMRDGLALPAIDVPRVSMTVRDVCLYRSHREDGGMVYTVIGRTARRS